MLGGVRGAVSIALAASIGVSALISQSDINLINTMVFGVAFISIMVQVPLLFRYVGKKMGKFEVATDKELNRNFEEIQAAIIEVNQLKAEGKITHQEATERVDKLKQELNQLLSKSAASLQTKDIIQARTSALLDSLKITSLIQKPKENNKRQNDENSTSSGSTTS